MKRLLFFSLSLFISCMLATGCGGDYSSGPDESSKAPTTWERDYFLGNSPERGVDVVETETGYAVLANVGTFPWYTALVTVDSHGNLLLSGGFLEDNSTVGRRLEYSPETGYKILAFGEFITGGVRNTEICTIKASTSGLLLNVQLWAGTVGDDYGLDWVAAADDGEVVAGMTRGAEGSFAIVVTKQDSMGLYDWRWESGPDIHGTGRSIETTDDGGFVVGGSREIGADDDDAILMKLDSAGSQQWATVFGGAGDQKIEAMVKMPGGQYIACASSLQSIGAMNQAVLLRFDQSGGILWQRVIDSLQPFNLAATANGDCVIVGCRAEHGYMARFDGGGQMMWERTYGKGASTIFNAVRSTSDGGLVVTGSIIDNGATAGLYIVKTDAQGLVD